MLNRWILPATVAALVVTAPVFAQTKNPVQKAGNYSIELRIPTEGIYAGEEIDLEFRLSDTSREDPVIGAPGIPRARVKAQVTMPAMPSMPKANPRVHAEGVPGDYGLVTTFPHGGDYQIDLTIVPPNEGEKEYNVSFNVSVKDEDPARAKRKDAAPKPYSLNLQLEPSRPVAGETVTLTISLKDNATGQIVTDYDIAHEELMHLVIVRDDLGEFFHEHPVFEDKSLKDQTENKGKFTLKFAFPNGGEWHLFADTAPKNAGSQVIMAKVDVDGARGLRANLMPSVGGPLVRVGGYTLTLKQPLRLTAKEMIPITFSLVDNRGLPVNDLDLYLGSLAHLIFVERDAQTFVHSHPDESDPRNGRNGTLTFLARFPKAGTYKGWMQFKRVGILTTMPFIVRVAK